MSPYEPWSVDSVNRFFSFFFLVVSLAPTILHCPFYSALFHKMLQALPNVLAVGLSICFYHVLGEGSLMRIMRAGSLQHWAISATLLHTFVCFFCFSWWDFSSSGCPGTHIVNQVELRDWPASASRVLGIKECAYIYFWGVTLQILCFSCFSMCACEYLYYCLKISCVCVRVGVSLFFGTGLHFIAAGS